MIITDEQWTPLYFDQFIWINNMYQELFIIHTSEDIQEYKRLFDSMHRDVHLGRLPSWLTEDENMYNFYQRTNGSGQLEIIQLYDLTNKEIIEKPVIWFMYYKKLTANDIRMILNGNQRRKGFIRISDTESPDMHITLKKINEIY